MQSPIVLQVDKNLRKIRELRSFSQDYVACQLGISIRAYSKLETGETQLTIKRLNEICEILEVSPLDVLTFNEKELFHSTKKKDNDDVYSLNSLLIQQLEQRINDLKNEIDFLRDQLKTR